MANSEKSAEGKRSRPTEAERAEREKSFSRRALIKAGWVVPVVMAVTPVRKALGGTIFADLGHTDGPPHDDFSDGGGGSPFGDTPFDDRF